MKKAGVLDSFTLLAYLKRETGYIGKLEIFLPLARKVKRLSS